MPAILSHLLSLILFNNPRERANVSLHDTNGEIEVREVNKNYVSLCATRMLDRPPLEL